MKAPFFSEPAHSPNFPQTTIRCHSVRVWYSPESLSFQLTLVASENRVWAVPLGVKRVSASLPRKPMSVMRFLQNILSSPFRAPSVGATESEWVLLPTESDALLGETFRGNRQSRVAPSRRAQGFDPEAEPNRRRPESEPRNCRSGTTEIKISEAARIEARQGVVHSRDVRSKRSGELPCEFRYLDGPRVGGIVRR